MIETSGLTPLMRQYVSIKQEYQDAIVLFQVGDFYEIFFDDAQKVAQFLGIALTKRGEVNGVPIPLCGFPVHAVNHYIPKLIKGGFKLAICDQIEPAITGKMVARAVTDVLTPATLVSDNLLDSKSQSFLFSFFPAKNGFGLLFSELLTSQLHATVLPYGAMRQLETELFRFLPDEILMMTHKSMMQYHSFFKERGFFLTSFALHFDQNLINQETEWLQKQFDQQSFDQMQKESSVLYATILWKKYLEKNQNRALSQVRSIQWYQPENFLLLDAATQKNLDLVKNNFDASSDHTIFSLLDQAITPMGSRMIKRWLLSPLMDQHIIQQRHQTIELFLTQRIILKNIEQILSQFCDVQRIVGRIALDKAHLHDYVNLQKILSLLPVLKQILKNSQVQYLHSIADALHDFFALQDLLQRACNDDMQNEGLIKHGYDPVLDRMKDLVAHAGQKILQMEQEEIVRTGINSLKIRQNNIAGYYIEITKANLDHVPDDFIESSTLVNRKRFTTKKLQSLQFEILQAQQQCASLEKEIFEKVKVEVKVFVHDLRIASFAIAQLDALVGMARVSLQWGWIRPEFHEHRDIIITRGKHPIVASLMHEKFIANDVCLNDQQSLLIITGPNMGGKSTYLRQVALISVLAQMGCFVPAVQAKLPILDRIFTRIGAGDFLAQGKSTFLVEMEETAQILQYATDRSLVILDEVGRGTSTYDGLALAQAIIEYIFIKIKARCLFATHYHELTSLQEQYPGIAIFHAESVQTAQGIIFLHKIVPGKADGSFGLQVARLAHIPDTVIQRASEVLHDLSVNDSKMTIVQRYQPTTKASAVDRSNVHPALNLIVSDLKTVDFDNLTAKQAYDLLWRYKELLEQ